MSARTVEVRSLVAGRAEGEAVVSLKAFTFAHGVEPNSGLVTDVRSDILGSSVKSKVLFYPYGKGSTTASAWFLEAVRLGNAPAALVTEGVDLSAVIGSIMAKTIYKVGVPVVSGFPRSAAGELQGRAKVRVQVEGSKVNILS